MRAAGLALLLAAVVLAQDGRWSQRGYLENRSLLFPRETSWDPAKAINETFLRYEFSLRIAEGLRFQGGLDAQTDTHRQSERNWHLSWDDRTPQRPAFAVRTFLLDYRRGPFRLEVGKQPLRWGATDYFSPTDKFSPRDYLSPSGVDLLGVWSARATVDLGRDSVELLYFPRFTPARAPLADQRWVFHPENAAGFTTRFRGIAYPGGPQFGARYRRIWTPVEFSVCFFNGYQVLPSILYSIDYLRRRITYSATYPPVRWTGGDVSVPWRGILWKGEAAYLTSRSPIADDVWLYSFQGERTAGDWVFGAGYLGEAVVVARRRTDLQVDRAASNAILGRVAWSPNPKDSVTSEWWLARNGDALVGRTLYSRLLSEDLRLSGGYTWIYGEPEDPVGRNGRNSHFLILLRYSF